MTPITSLPCFLDFFSTTITLPAAVQQVLQEYHRPGRIHRGPDVDSSQEPRVSEAQVT